MSWKVVFDIGPYHYYETYVTAESREAAVEEAEAVARWLGWGGIGFRLFASQNLPKE